MTTTPATAARQIEHLRLGDLRPDPRNPKAHSVGTIDASVGRFGFVEPIVLDGRTGYIISGHGRAKTLTAMRERGESPPEGVVVDAASGEWLVPVVTGWASRTDTEAHAALIALNRTTELGGWVDDSLLAMLDELSADEGGLDGVGFAEDDIAALREKLDALGTEDPEDDDDEDGGGRAPSTGEMLALADVAWGEPEHKVAHGEVWQVGRHTLICAKVQAEHEVWMPYLAWLAKAEEGVLFCPYPEPYLTAGTTAAERTLLLVQPNAYLAGHLLDKHAAAFPDETVEKIA